MAEISKFTNFSKSVQEAIYFISVIHKDQNENIKQNFKTLVDYCDGDYDGFFHSSISSDFSEPLLWRYSLNGKIVFAVEYFYGKGLRGRIKIERSQNHYDIKVRVGIDH